MTGKVGRIDTFDESIERWEAYKERLDQYFIANTIKEEKQVPALLSLIGGRTYGLLRDLTAPDLPATKTYPVLTKILQDHYSPKPLVIAERYRFHKRDQREGESIRDYNAALRKLSENCTFGDTLNDTLRDRLVCGLKAEHIQKKLLTESDLTYQKALEVAIAFETATKDAVELQRQHVKTPVHKIRKEKVQQQTTKKPSFPNKHDKNKVCYRCKGTHHPNDCHFKDAICHKCNKKGHIKKACLSGKPWKKGAPVHRVQDDSGSEPEMISSLEIFDISSRSGESGGSDAIWLHPMVDDVELAMELDTGSAVSIISQSTFDRYFSKRKSDIRETKVTLKTYSGEKLSPLGVFEVQVGLNSQHKRLELFVVKHGGPPLFGRDWLRSIKLNWHEIKTVTVTGGSKQTLSVAQQLEKYPEVFKDELGTLKDITARIKVKEGANPKFCKARTVPFALKEKVDAELNRLVEAGILTKVEHSEWATPIVPIPKRDGSVRICGDFKVTVNQVLDVDQYPLPRIDDIFATLAGGQHFTKIDLKNAYLQMVVREEDQPYLTINTHRGLFRYNRLVFGISSAPAIWQRSIDQVLQGVPRVQCILDDMIVTGTTDEEHLENLETVLQRLDRYGLRVNKDKCEFFKDSIEFCGHTIDKDGLHKTPSKVETVVKAPCPENVSQLKSFLGLVNYYAKFIQNLSSIVNPLNQLLEADRKWVWSKECDAAFRRVKEVVASEQVLTHFDPSKKVQLATDASPYGLGAVLSHMMEDGSERPIAFASRSLSKSERNYSQIDKEALGIVWGVKKFYQYLYGRLFILLTDHQPLTSIFHPEKGIPMTTAARLQRYALFLAGFQYDIKYKSTTRHANADCLSRLPLVSKKETEGDTVETFIVSHMDTLPVTSKEISRETLKDPTLSKVYTTVQRGWIEGEDKCLGIFYNKRLEISIHQNCLFWGIRVIVPSALRQRVLDELHEGHVGVVKMKGLARSYVWWPGIDTDIEHVCKSCTGCQEVKHAPPAAPIHPWEWPSIPWQRIHIDFAGPFLDMMFFVAVDAHSKWPEVVPMKTTTAEKTVEVMREIFSRNGVPAQVVSDNGPQFVSEHFSNFMRCNGIKHTTSAPYHPSTNGLAERFVQSFKGAMKASKKDSGSVQKGLANLLLAYRNSKHMTTNETPAKLFIGRNLPSRLDLIKPDIRRRVDEHRWKQESKRQVPCRSFSVGEPVSIRDYRGSQKWIYGKVAEKTGPVSYKVEIAPGVFWRRHLDQLRATEVVEKPSEVNLPVKGDVTPNSPTVLLENTVSNKSRVIDNSVSSVPSTMCQESSSEVSSPSPVIEPCPTPENMLTPKRRYPRRNIVPPKKLQDFVTT
ncbi:uncharacterized protein K02A2.6-like [Pecten maximus]|uniref:uncharacterized protein K02A2.6-like n=1 Tax=Pecten maximus TaxID=6579 RepID=UPI001458F81F|nr:uncharacterized protein K02A2.6-like [Pecten maximus]